MRKNCYFSDFDLYFTARLIKSITLDVIRGYYIEISLPYTRIKDLRGIGVFPDYRKGEYILYVKLNNRTKLTMNGRKIDYFDHNLFIDIPVDGLSIRKLVLKQYSNRMQNTYDCQCYALELMLVEN